MRRRLRAVLCALLVLGAGCAAPTHDATPDDPIAIEGGSLPVDPDVTFDRISALLGADVAPPDTIRVVPAENRSTNGTSGGLVPAFFAAVDVDTDPGEGLTGTERAGLANGAVSLGTGTITIFRARGDDEAVRWVLAHELVHYVQAATGAGTTLRRNLDQTTEASAIVRSVLEGAAVFTTDRYLARLEVTNQSNADVYQSLREQLAPGSYARHVNDLYVYGARYASWRLPAPNATEELYEAPPQTTEQLIHRFPPDDERPRSLSVSTELGAYRHVATDRLGEAFLRTFLENGLTSTSAARAAAGWGNDTLRTFRRTGADRPGYAWVLRFDDAANATEFGDAVDAALAETATRENGSWALRESWASVAVHHVSPATVALAVGTPGFLGNVSVSGDGATISLDLAGS